MNLKEEIAKLVSLQEIDSQLYVLQEQERTIVPEHLKSLKTSFENAKEALAQAEAKVKETQLNRKQRELDLNVKEEAAHKAQSQLYQLKTNKEYQAKLSEIASLKADVSLIEEEVIKALEAIEKAEQAFQKEKETLAIEENKFQEEEKKAQSELKEIETQIKQLEDKRKILAKEINPQLSSKYERLLNVRSGLAIVPVKGANCNACHMRVTHQKINEIKMYMEPAYCESCLRILYIPEDIDG